MIGRRYFTHHIFCVGVKVISTEFLVLIKVPDDLNIGGCVLENGWCQLTAQVPTYPKEVPLYKSPQFDVGPLDLIHTR